MAARKAAVAATQRSASEPSSAAAAAGAGSARVASHSARVGSRSTAPRLRPHAAQKTPAPGGSPQYGQTRSIATTWCQSRRRARALAVDAPTAHDRRTMADTPPLVAGPLYGLRTWAVVGPPGEERLGGPPRRAPRPRRGGRALPA